MKIKHKSQISLEEMRKEQELLQAKLKGYQAKMEGYQAGISFRNSELTLMAHPGAYKCDWCGQRYYSPSMFGTYIKGGGSSFYNTDLCVDCISEMLRQHERYENEEITGDEYRAALADYRCEVRSDSNETRIR